MRQPTREEVMKAIAEGVMGGGLVYAKAADAIMALLEDKPPKWEEEVRRGNLGCWDIDKTVLFIREKLRELCTDMVDNRGFKDAVLIKKWGLK